MPTSFPHCNHVALNDRCMWLYRKVVDLDAAAPGSPAFRDHLGALGAAIRNLFVLEEELVRHLAPALVQDQVVDHVQLLCYLRYLLASPVAAPKLATLQDEFRTMLRRHLFERDRRLVTAVNDALAASEIDHLPGGRPAGALLHRVLSLPWSGPGNG